MAHSTSEIASSIRPPRDARATGTTSSSDDLLIVDHGRHRRAMLLSLRVELLTHTSARHVDLVRSSEPKLDIRLPFSFSWFVSEQSQIWIELNQRQSKPASQPSDHSRHLRWYSRLPPQSEQRAIAAALSDVDALLDGLTGSSPRSATSSRPPCSSSSPARPAFPASSGEWEVKRSWADLAHVRRRQRSDAETTTRSGTACVDRRIYYVTVTDFVKALAVRWISLTSRRLLRALEIGES